MPDDQTRVREMDILEMPVTGLAAYWLSLKKLLDTRKGAKVLQEEMAAVREPFIRHLLDAALVPALSEETVRRLLAAKRRVVLRELHRRLDLMRLALLAMATGENPQRVLSRMSALYPVPPVRETEAMEKAYALLEGVKKGEADEAAFVAVDHVSRPEHLVVMLLYVILLARREGKEACRRLVAPARSLYFAEGLALLADGFEEAFLRQRLDAHKRAILSDTLMKMEMAEELCLGIRAKYSYDDLWRIARAYLPGD